MCAVRNSFFCTKIKYIINYKNLFIHTSSILRKVRNKIRKLQKISKNYFVCWEIWGSRSPDQYTRLVISINSGVLIAATQTLVSFTCILLGCFSFPLVYMFSFILKNKVWSIIETAYNKFYYSGTSIQGTPSGLKKRCFLNGGWAGVCQYLTKK